MKCFNVHSYTGYDWEYIRKRPFLIFRLSFYRPFVKFLFSGYFLLGILTISSCSGQDTKELMRAARENMKLKNYEKAEEYLKQALDQKPGWKDALEERALCYYLQQKNGKALDDYSALHAAHPLKPEYIIGSAKSLYELNRPSEVINMLVKLESPDINLHVGEAKQYVVKSYMKLRNFEMAVSKADIGMIDFPEQYEFALLKGIAADSLADIQLALLSYEKAYEIIRKLSGKSKNNPGLIKPEYYPVYTSLGNSRIIFSQYDEAMEILQQAIKCREDNALALYLMGKACYMKSDGLNAIAWLTKSIEKSRGYEAFLLRAKSYKKTGQFNLAVKDLDTIITTDTCWNALYLRGQCAESTGDYEQAKSDYERCLLTVPLKSRKEIELSVYRTEKRLYETRRENQPPILHLQYPVPDLHKNVFVAKSNTMVEFRGRVTDDSKVKLIQINGIDAAFHPDSLNPTFQLKMSLSEKNEINFKIVDVYGNTAHNQFQIDRQEKNPANVELHNPSTNAPPQIFINRKKDKEILISGQVDDESLIKNIVVNGVNASFSLNAINPEFSVEIEIGKADSIVLYIRDEFDNQSRISYYINSSDPDDLVQKQAGNTWVVFIANSEYVYYSSLDGPKVDVDILRNSLAAYEISNFLVKENLTYAEMDKFFRLELRDLIRKNQVNSLLIWFAGHGRYLNETGYWVPSDAKKNDEAGYYPVNYLSGNIAGYGQSLQHVLVISDACEAGPSFSSVPQKFTEISCEKFIEKNNKSAEFFTSTSHEKAADNSVFCRSFADALTNHNQPCIGIQQIVPTVTEIVNFNQKQQCRFGLIEHPLNQQGTFIFVRKKK